MGQVDTSEVAEAGFVGVARRGRRVHPITTTASTGSTHSDG